MADPGQVVLAVCNKLRHVLAAVWIVNLVALAFVVFYFL
jgi:hypothetical protein